MRLYEEGHGLLGRNGKQHQDMLVLHLFQQVLHLPLPALSGRHHLQFFLLGDLRQRRLLVRFVLLRQLLLQQAHLLPAGGTRCTSVCASFCFIFLPLKGGAEGRGGEGLPQCLSPFVVQLIGHLVHLLFLLRSDGHHSGVMLLSLGLDLLLQTQRAARI